MHRFRRRCSLLHAIRAVPRPRVVLVRVALLHGVLASGCTSASNTMEGDGEVATGMTSERTVTGMTTDGDGVDSTEDMGTTSGMTTVTGSASSDSDDTSDGGEGQCAAEVASKHEHSCARTSDGALWCWGQLPLFGTDGYTQTPIPAEFRPLSNDVVQVDVSLSHTCVLAANGTLWCWGMNDTGQLGDGTGVPSSSPVEVSALGSDVVEVALGHHAHGCARKADGTLWCWGYNHHGQLGDGTDSNRLSPVEVSALGSDVVEVALGNFHTCARKQDGTLWCWGHNFHGQLGDGTNIDNSSPVEVGDLASDVVEVALGAFHTCARKNDGTLWCWGSNTGAWLGDTQWSPIEVSALGSEVAEISLGYNHCCARKEDGTLWCWGDDGFGQLGQGDTGSAVLATNPVEVPSLSGEVAQVALGHFHSCARKTDDTIWCWGNNDVGQLGDGTTMDTATPVEVISCP